MHCKYLKTNGQFISTLKYTIHTDILPCIHTNHYHCIIYMHKTLTQTPTQILSSAYTTKIPTQYNTISTTDIAVNLIIQNVANILMLLVQRSFWVQYEVLHMYLSHLKACEFPIWLNRIRWCWSERKTWLATRLWGHVTLELNAFTFVA